MTRAHDVVLYGASSFVGRLVAAHLAEHAPAGTRIALAGRNRARVEAVRAQLPPGGRGWPVLTADSDDPASLADLAGSTAVLVTTVGPYAKYGLPVVEACARAGTHYADLTGEVLFVRDAIAATDAVARETGARIVHACGYDSIPSDLAVAELAARAAADGAGGLTDVQTVATAKGGFSGGTVDSLRTQVAAIAADPSLRRVVGDPFALSPDRDAEPATRQPRDGAKPSRAADGRWSAAFVMAPFNTRVVRRSNALQDWSYGRGFSYGEVMATGRGVPGAVAAGVVTGGLLAAVSAMAFGPTASLLDRVLPAPGSGPSEETRRNGFFRMVTTGATDSGRRYRSVASGPGDPGYAATAVMLGQTALALALDADRLPERAGSLTPATALGPVLVERLRAAGHTYEVTEVG
ncbi:trans-acting enoyl reductase family protein [Modestobacter sp. Leaf380]|uniref:saccharopine dehydrogenase family protein n=1 Tax=Modestobacter sp. Leaf380 TaxID=1736356 RepID=UPI0006FFA7BD|nr:saccharopine dehydrogenase NADP-binding domain-containing protein [Modestobacter sp. Leaf380]KQS69840.1 enoyl-ACP reductase [Modestobacter sp. Leaf380]